MSQHVFRVDVDHECVVGWDPMLLTFFGQVYKIDKSGERVPPEDNGTVLWVGASPGVHIRSVRELERLLSPYVRSFTKYLSDTLEFESND